VTSLRAARSSKGRDDVSARKFYQRIYCDVFISDFVLKVFIGTSVKKRIILVLVSCDPYFTRSSIKMVSTSRPMADRVNTEYIEQGLQILFDALSATVITKGNRMKNLL
jgi:phosphatidylinositol kinase/protein kinase (PI-3  family)